MIPQKPFPKGMMVFKGEYPSVADMQANITAPKYGFLVTITNDETRSGIKCSYVYKDSWVFLGGDGVGSGGGGSSYTQVTNYSSLPDATTVAGEVYIVQQTTGIIFINRKLAGLYRSDGVSWTHLGMDVDTTAIKVNGTTVIAQGGGIELKTTAITATANTGDNSILLDATHNHDAVYANLNHTHVDYSLTTHNHDERYALKGEGGGGSGVTINQITKLAVNATRLVDVTIPNDASFARMEPAILKFIPDASAQTNTICSFNNANASDFYVDDTISMDGSMHLNCVQEQVMADNGALGGGKTFISTTISRNIFAHFDLLEVY